MHAEQPEIIRSHQKDEFFVEKLRSDFSASFLDFIGPRKFVKYKNEINALGHVCYLYLTTGSGFQTLGEEYCSVIQLDKKTSRIPSTQKRQLLVLLACFGPYIGDKSLVLLQSCLNYSRGVNTGEQVMSDELLDFLRKLFTVVSRMHLALFYFQGTFYEVAKRIMGVRYMLLRDFLKDSSARTSYKLLSLLLGVQLLVTAPCLLHQLFKSMRTLRRGQLSASLCSEKEDTSTSLPIAGIRNKLKCPLCLNGVSHVTATACGHMFCWHCIIDWCATKPECPVCRDAISPSRLIYIRNFQPA